MSENSNSEKADIPSIAEPFLQALNRLKQRRTPSPDDVQARASDLLVQTFGDSDEAAETCFAFGTTALISEHTHYFDGFAFLLPLPYCAAVSIRLGATAEVVLDTSGNRYELNGEGELPVGVQLLQNIIGRLVPDAPDLQIAVVNTIPACGIEAFMSALAVSSIKALMRLFGLSLEPLERHIIARELITRTSGRPFSIAYPITSDSGTASEFVLVDAGTLEHLPLPVPPPEQIGWGLIDTGTGIMRDAEFFKMRALETDLALKELRKNGFGSLPSFRELDHQDLQRALSVLPNDLRDTARYLVTENRRVQKIVASVRKNDWQMFGALLVMSHASQRQDWGYTSPQADFVVNQVEGMSLEGLYGACMSGRGGCVLIVGRAFDLPQGLDRIGDAFEERFGKRPSTMLL